MNSNTTFNSIYPYTGETVGTYTALTDSELSNKISNGEESYQAWQSTSLDKRSQCLSKLGEVLSRNKAKLAKLITMEMGKPIKESIAEIDKCAITCDFYAEQGHGFLARKHMDNLPNCYVDFLPLGGILAIMPWNFPFWQVIRCAAPALLAGNVVFLKHAPNVFGCAQAIQEVFEEAGFPQHVFQTLIIDVDAVEKVIAHPFVRAVSFTGSEKGGAQVAALAGKYIKKTVLELGGSDPAIILDDADIPLAVKKGLASRLMNAGQSCIAAKRFIVVKSKEAAFVQHVLEEIKQYKVADPLDENTKMGCLARQDIADKIAVQLRMSLATGSELIYDGGEARDCIFPPKVVKVDNADDVLFKEETFGPLLAYLVVQDEETAINIANETSYGLGASIYTADIEKGRNIAKRLDCGSVFINDLVKSGAGYPFGGVKNSGYGRELSYFGLHEFTNIQTVFVGS